MDDNRIEIRCIGCGKLLGKVPEGTDTTIEIKCAKCKTIHIYKIGGVSMRTFRFEILAHEEIDIKAENLDEAMEKADAMWNKRFKGMFGEAEYIGEAEGEGQDDNYN